VALARGELAQRQDAFDTSIGEERYLERCRLKTAALFECAVLLGRDDEQIGGVGRAVGPALPPRAAALAPAGPPPPGREARPARPTGPGRHAGPTCSTASSPSP